MAFHMCDESRKEIEQNSNVISCVNEPHKVNLFNPSDKMCSVLKPWITGPVKQCVQLVKPRFQK